jgi:opacity protein-like surface antigen
MIKKAHATFYTATCLSLIVSSQASTVTPPPCGISHSINVGAGMGWHYSRFHFDATEAFGGPSTNRKFDLGKNSFAGDLSLGYRLRWHNIMAGLEVDYLFMGLKRSGDLENLSDGTSSRPAQVKSNGAFGAALKLGYYVRDDLIGYVGAGIENRKFKVQYTVQNQPNDSISNNHSQTAFAGRLGFDFAITPYVLLGAEYRKAFYNGKTIQNGNTTLKFKPETVDTLLLNVRFNFNLPKLKSLI